MESVLCQQCPKPKSSDPNDIAGPVGFGAQDWVFSANSPLSYTILFQNDPLKAQAPAKQVQITLPLDKNFDPRTFRLGSFGFGGMAFSVPSNSAFYQTNLDFTATNGYFLQVFAGVDIANAQAFWTFTTIDPATGDIPENPFLGFLPPDTTPPEGEGYVTCSVSPLAGVTTGTQVSEQATIIFDNQAPLATPVAVNTLEAGGPASTVLPLPAVSASPTFTVAWQGVNIPGGVGIAAYDIYVSQNGGAYYAWLQGTPLNQAPFTGQAGNTYAFYSIALDQAGAIQTTPAQPNTSTVVTTNQPPVIPKIPSVVARPDCQVSVQVYATDPNGDQLTFSLGPGAPPDASIQTNGLFTWTPSRAYAETTNSITVVASEIAAVSLSATQTFVVTVLDYLEWISAPRTFTPARAPPCPSRWPPTTA